MKLTNLPNDLKCVHDQLEDAYDDNHLNKNLVYSEPESQKFLVILASVILALIVILA